ncbi:MAG: hypothetical protein ACRC46_14340 [Thermoguttaceae bacterium]
MNYHSTQNSSFQRQHCRERIHPLAQNNHTRCIAIFVTPAKSLREDEIERERFHETPPRTQRGDEQQRAILPTFLWLAMTASFVRV